jgi:putative transposase
METMARLLIDVLFHYRNEGAYRLHAFVVMRDHFHVLLTIEGDGSVEDAVRRIKGGFSYRAKRELAFKREIWQRGFTDERVRNAEQFCAVRAYIHENPVRKRIVFTAEDYPFSSAHPQYRKTQGLKPEST